MVSFDDIDDWAPKLAAGDHGRLNRGVGLPIVEKRRRFLILTYFSPDRFVKAVVDGWI